MCAQLAKFATAHLIFLFHYPRMTPTHPGRTDDTFGCDEVRAQYVALRLKWGGSKRENGNRMFCACEWRIFCFVSYLFSFFSLSLPIHGGVLGAHRTTSLKHQVE